MDLRQLKQEIDSLPAIRELTGKFHEHWIQLLQENSSTFFLKGMNNSVWKQTSPKVAKAQKALQSIQHSKIISEKLHHYAHYLIELKLASLNGDQQKLKMFRQQLEDDPYLNLNIITAEIDAYGKTVKALEQEYQEVNDLLSCLPLEELISFSDRPHKMHLHSLQKLGRDYSRIAQDLHQSFSSLVMGKK